MQNNDFSRIISANINSVYFGMRLSQEIFQSHQNIFSGDIQNGGNQKVKLKL